MISFPPTNPKPTEKKPKKSMRDEIVESVMKRTGMSREEAERQYDAVN